MFRTKKNPCAISTFVFLYALSILFSNSALAFIPEIPFDDLVHQADVVFVGTVAEKCPKVAQSRKTVETDAVFTQIRMLHQRDAAAEKIGDRIVLTYAGGRFNEVFTYVSDMPRIETGRTYLVFAYYDGQPHANPFVGGEQGLFKIAADESTGKLYPMKIDGLCIADIQDGEFQLTPPVKMVRQGLPEKAESRVKIERAPGPRTPAEWPAGPMTGNARMLEKILDLDEMIRNIETVLKKGPSDRVLEKRIQRAAATSEKQDSAKQKSESNQNAWEFSDDGKMVILDPARVNCRPADQKTSVEGDIRVQKGYNTAPAGGTSWDDIFIYGWHDLPVIMDLLPADYWTYDSDTHAMSNFNLYIDELFRVRPWDGGFGWLNTWSEFCGFLTDTQHRDVFSGGWDDAIAECWHSGGLCETCEMFETDVVFNAHINWTTDYKCQLARGETGGCNDAYLYLRTATHELGHTFGLMCGKETYDYDVPTVMNGGLYKAVEDARGLHVGDAYLLRYWYADQRNDAAMNHEDIGIESWIAQGGTVNAATDKKTYDIGEQVWIENITIENIGRHDAPDVRVRAFLSENGELRSLVSERNELDLNLIPSDRRLIGPPPSNEYYTWDNLPANTFWTGELAFVIPDGIPMGNYYINLAITANDDQSVVGAAPGDTSYHEVTILNNHTFVKLPIEVTCPKPSPPSNFRQQGTDADGVGLAWDAIADARYYMILRNTSNDAGSAEVLKTTLATNAYKDTAAVPGTGYYYWVAVQSQCRAWSDNARLASVATRPLASPCIQSAADGTSIDEVQVIAQRVDQGDYYCFYSNTENNPVTASQIEGECWTSDTSALHQSIPGKSYYYWAKAATDAAGANATGLGGACPDNIGWRKLSPPTGVGASRDDTEGVRISWTASPGAAAYRLYRGMENDPDGAAAITDWSADMLTHFDSPVEEGRQYYYWVKAAVGSTGSRPSDLSVSAAGWKAYAPAPKVDLTGLGASKGAYRNKVAIAWYPVANDTYYYRVYRTPNLSPEGDPDPASAIPVSPWLPSATSFDDTTGIPGKDYGYFISRAYDADGYRESDWQYCSACFDSGWRALSSPPDVTPSAGAFADRIRVAWSPAEGASHYKVYRGNSEVYSIMNPPSPVGGFVEGTQFEDLDPALESRTVYYYWVTSAVNAGGERQSSSINILGKRGYKASSPPANVSATDGAHAEKVAISWDPVPGLGQYQVYRNSIDDSGTATRLGSWQNSSGYEDNAADTGQIYYYWVRGRVDKNDSEPSPFSDADFGYRGYVPPTDVAASDGAYFDKVAVSWQASAEASYYRVYRNIVDNAGEAEAVSSWQTALSFEDTDCAVGTVYFYFVAAAADEKGFLASNFGSGDPGHRVLAPPINVMASKGTFKSCVGVSWEKDADEATHFMVYRSIQDDPETFLPVSDWISEKYFEDVSASPDQMYYYAVTEATDTHGANESDFSEPDTGHLWIRLLGDVNGNQTIELEDALVAFQIGAGMSQIVSSNQHEGVASDGDIGEDEVIFVRINLDADVNEDGKIGIAEAIYVMRYVAGMR